MSSSVRHGTRGAHEARSCSGTSRESGERAQDWTTLTKNTYGRASCPSARAVPETRNRPLVVIAGRS